MNEERRRILEMLEQGKISASEAERLLDAVEKTASDDRRAQPAPGGKVSPKYLRVTVEGEDEHVDVRVPIQLVRAGIKLDSLMPHGARGKVAEALGREGINIDFGNLKPEMIDDLVEAMTDLKVDASDKGKKVRVFCE